MQMPHLSDSYNAEKKQLQERMRALRDEAAAIEEEVERINKVGVNDKLIDGGSPDVTSGLPIAIQEEMDSDVTA